ncbi:hypothetical protein ACFLYO_06780 [Chloroflexota bacterium]
MSEPAAPKRTRRFMLGILLIILTLTLPTRHLSMAFAQSGTPPFEPDDLFSTSTPLPSLTGGPLLGGNTDASAGVFIYNLATGQQRELSFGPGDHWFGDFAPDGCHFAFLMSDANNQNIRLYTARLDGADVQELIDFTDDSGAVRWEVWSPDWSPSQGSADERIAFVLVRHYDDGAGQHSQTTHIAGLSPTGGVPTIYSSSGTEGAPIWSPDGQWLAYTSYDFSNGWRENDLWIVSADGSTKNRLTDFATGSTLFPRWSPNGETVSFIYAPSGNNHQFWTTPASGGAVQQWSGIWTLVLGYDWLPDGSGLVAAIKGWQDHDDNILWHIPLPGFADNDSTLYLADPAATAVDYPRFSLDGRYLAFRSAYSPMIYDTVSGELRLLADAGLNNSPLAWGPANFSGEQDCY